VALQQGNEQSAETNLLNAAFATEPSGSYSNFHRLSSQGLDDHTEAL
jgi:hypothetical protein